MAEVPLASKGIEGFVLPEPAVVWYGNAAWVFVKTAPERFVRRALRDPRSTRGEIFTTTPFDDDDKVVVTGAQLLQSELLRAKTSSAPKPKSCMKSLAGTALWSTTTKT